MRASCCANALGIFILMCCASLVQAADGGHIRKAQLIGAWRLVSMDYRGPDNASVDPFYQPESTGLIIYDRSGWMSVQITGPHRQGWKEPASRLPRRRSQAAAPTRLTNTRQRFGYWRDSSWKAV